jgi:hypothetical protein
MDLMCFPFICRSVFPCSLSPPPFFFCFFFVFPLLLLLLLLLLLVVISTIHFTAGFQSFIE